MSYGLLHSPDADTQVQVHRSEDVRRGGVASGVVISTKRNHKPKRVHDVCDLAEYASLRNQSVLH